MPTAHHPDAGVVGSLSVFGSREQAIRCGDQNAVPIVRSGAARIIERASSAAHGDCDQCQSGMTRGHRHLTPKLDR
jgi:hypothetical protein